MTKQRQIIYDAICMLDHPSADQIYLCAKEKLPAIAVGTVYRNLRLMEEAGEIHRIPMANAPDKYDSTLAPHYHAICGSCGRVKDVFTEDIGKIFAEKNGLFVTDCQVNITDRCPACCNADCKAN